MKLKSFKKNAVNAILPVIILSILAISYLRLLDIYELGTLDFRFAVRPKLPTTDKVAIIEIGEDSIKKLGRFPFDRSYHAVLIKALSEAGAKAIVFDLFFSEPQEHDLELEDAIGKAGNAYLPFVFEIDKEKRQIPTARAYAAKTLENFSILCKGAGHINVTPDIDGKFRKAPAYIQYKNALYPYLSLMVSLGYLGIPEKAVKILPGKYLILSPDIKIPLDESSNILINFSGRWGGSYKHYSYVDILQSYFARLSGARPTLDLDLFKDKVCFVGLTAVGTTDLHPSPFEPLYPAIGMHIELFNSVLNKTFIFRASRGANLLILAMLCILILVGTLKTKPINGLLILLAVIIFFAATCVFLFNIFGIWIDMFYPILLTIVIYICVILFKYIIEWKQRLVMDNELGTAKKIQASFLPKKLPAIEGLDIQAAMLTARQVGGDLYYFIEFGSDKLGVMIGDVSGKGIPASLFMAVATTKFKFFANPEAPPQDVLYNLNSSLVKESASNLFVTIFYLVFDMKNRIVRYANGGHIPVLALSRDGRTEFLDVKEGMPLGLMDCEYSGREMKLARGDLFVLCTDGITEAMNTQSEMYGQERLASIVKANKALSSKELLNAIEKDVRKFEAKARQHDDMAFIVVKIVW